jgi:hypothetical protein
MNPDYEPESENSRRTFMQRLGALAAASSVAASASAQQPPAGAAAGRGGRGPRENPAVKQPGPLAQQPMPTVKFGKFEIGRLVMGVNGPGAHFSVKEGMDARAYLTPDKIAEENKHMQELGINCMEAGGRFAQYAEQTGANMMWSARGSAKTGKETRPWQSPKDILERSKVKPISIHHQGAGDNGTDAWWRQGKLNAVREYCKMIRDSGVLVAITSHQPKVFMEIESQGWDVDYYMTCLYKYGRTHSEWVEKFKSNPEMLPVEIGYPTEGNSELYGGEIAFVQGDPPEMLKVVKQCKKPCWVYKLLASTRLTQREDIVEDRFKYILSNIKSTDAMVVGMWGKYSDEFALNKEYVIKYGGTSVKVS